MLGLASYVDESGDPDDPKCRFFGLAGLCASETNWTDFDQKWTEIIAVKCGGVAFHMKDFAHHRGIFEDWKEKQRRELLAALVKVIRESKARPFGSVVNLEAYKFLESIMPGAAHYLNEPYHLCFQDITRAAALMAMEHSDPFVPGENEVVAMVYAQQFDYGTVQSQKHDENRGRSEKLWYAIKEHNPHFGRWMGSYASSIPDNLTFLQAADLFAYELVHEYENRAREDRKLDSMRWGLSQLLPEDGRNFLHTYYGIYELVEILMSNNLLIVPDSDRHALATHSNMNKLEMKNWLFQRLGERKLKDENTA